MNRLHTIQGHLQPVASQQVNSMAQQTGGMLDPQSYLPSFLQPATDSEFHAGHLVAEVLRSHGCEQVFTLVGGHISPILVAAEQLGIRVVDTRHEANAVFAADAVARLTGLVGVAAVTAGPGLTNTITAVKNAQMAQSPLLLLSGAAPSLTKNRGALQDIDQMSLVKSLCKFTATANSVSSVVPLMKKAFQAAQSGIPGPVFIEFPIDVLWPIMEVKANLSFLDRKKFGEFSEADRKRIIVPDHAARKAANQRNKVKGSTRQLFLKDRKPTDIVFVEKEQTRTGLQNKLVGMYMNMKLRNIFGGQWADGQKSLEQFDFSPLPVSIPKPSPGDVAKTAALIAAAKRPVLVVASQAMLQPELSDRLQDAVRTLGIPTFLGGMARGLMGRDHPYFIRQNRGLALAESDCVILCGAVADFRLGYGRALPSNVPIVSVNRSKKDGTINTDAFWRCSLAVEADPGLFLLDVCDLVNGISMETKSPGRMFPFGHFDSWASKLKMMEGKKEAINTRKGKAPALGRGEKAGQALINPLDLCNKLEEVLPDNAVLVVDGGDFVATAAYTVRPRKPLSWLDPGAFGTLGVGAGFALGAKICKPDSEVWVIWGDGSAGYSIAEYDTFERHKTPIISLIGNDACWSQIERDQTPIFGSPVACNLSYCDYAQIAEGYGGKGLTLERSDDVTKVFEEARALHKEGHSVCINAMIGKSDFREGSISA